MLEKDLNKYCEKGTSDKKPVLCKYKQCNKCKKRMIAKYTDFSNGLNLEDCVFFLMKNTKNEYCLDTLYSSKKVDAKSKEWFYTFDEILKLTDFSISNKKTTKKSKYKTSEKFINRLRKERNAIHTRK